MPSSFWLPLCELGLASTRCGLKAPSETCDVWRGDILAGIQLIVHQSGRAAMTLFNSLYGRQMTTAAMPFKTSEKTSRHHVWCIRNGNQVLLGVLLIPFVLQRLMHMGLLESMRALCVAYGCSIWAKFFYPLVVWMVLVCRRGGK